MTRRAYLAEFVMMFLAVTLSFFAENMRQEWSNRAAAREYLQLLADDLHDDVERLDFSIGFKRKKEAQIDEFIALLRSPDRTQSTARIYYLGRLIPVREPFYGSEGAIRQLENTGGLRLLRNHAIIVALNRYIAARAKVYEIQQLRDINSIQYKLAANRVLDAGVLAPLLNTDTNGDMPYGIRPPEGNPPLFSLAAEDINALIYWASNDKGSEEMNRQLMSRLKQEALDLRARILQELS
ncbi:MAG: hypothetical protein ACKOBZ_01290 [Nitrospira sp.]